MLRHTCMQLTKFRPVGQCLRNALLPTMPRQTFVRFKHYKPQGKPDRTNYRDMGYVLLTMPLATFLLGCWQVQRRKWKLGLIENLERRTHSPAVPLPLEIDEINELEYCRVTVTGRFDHSKEVYITPVSQVADENKKRGLITESGVGAFVVTPFHLSDRNWTILVNRGYVPKKRMNPATRPEGQIEQEVELTGLVRITEKRQQFQPKSGSIPGRWLRRDVTSIAEYLGTEPVFLDADRASTIQGGPIGGQTRVNLRNEHLSYILTWWSLTAIITFMWYQRYWLRVM